jgi:hypothetical protein
MESSTTKFYVKPSSECVSTPTMHACMYQDQSVPSGVLVIELFSSSRTLRANKLECLSLTLNIGHCLIFTGKAMGGVAEGATLGWIKSKSQILD